ncbi:MAG: UbiD family decarboxylase [Chitinophagales bacterium]
MGYKSLQSCIDDLEKHNHLVRVKEEVDPYLEMATIQLRVYENNGPAILFENVKGSQYPAVSNLFGSLDRSKFMFRDTIDKVKKLIKLKADPTVILKQPLQNLWVPFTALTALPRKKYFGKSLIKNEIKISDIPQIHHWQMDGGAFVTLPAVYTEDSDRPGVMQSNLGMYRIQLGGNDYIQDKEIGLHYQLHRGIGVHQTKANAKGQPLKVSIFVGGPPANIFSAVMPLPEGMSELTFAGALGGRRFKYYYDKDGFCISADADFVITGEVYPGENKIEGPFGDHLGYYSLKHDFPLMRVKKVYAKQNAIWPFTVVGRPPQEDTSFGALIHDITGDIIPSEVPGVHEVHAVDAAGVHPLLIAIGSERYTPYYKDKQPKEILTIANHILGTGQMSLAKYLFITNKADAPNLTTHEVADYFMHVLERVDLSRDIHFYTKTSIDTLDYSGTGLNTGSKVVIAAAGDPIRKLSTAIHELKLCDGFSNPKVALPGVLAIKANPFTDIESAKRQMRELSAVLATQNLDGFPLIVICDDSDFVARTLNNFVWVTFTRSNPSHDIYGVEEFTQFKHWGCQGSMIIDARIKPHHAPILEIDPDVNKKVDRLGVKGASLHGII